MILNALEIDKICLFVKQNYHFDLSNYFFASLQRQIHKYMQAFKLDSLDQLLSRIDTDIVLFDEFISEITVNTTEMFRDPIVWKSINSKIIAELSTKQNIKIWHAACSSGQEQLSMSILLDQANLLDRCTTLATDINPIMLQIAYKSTYSFRCLEIYQKNYSELQLPNQFNQYYKINDANAKFIERLNNRVSYLKHNLLTGAHGELFDIIFCRNILIYFNIKSQDQIFSELYKALSPGGFLIIGYYEVPYNLTHYTSMSQVCENLNIFRKNYK